MKRRVQLAVILASLMLGTACERVPAFDQETAFVSHSLAGVLGPGSSPKIGRSENSMYAEWQYSSVDSPEIVRRSLLNHRPDGYKELEAVGDHLVFAKSQKGDAYQVIITVRPSLANTDVTTVSVTLRSFPD